MTIRFLILIGIMVLTGCQSAKTYTRADLEAYGEAYGVEAPVGADGLTVDEALELDEQRHQQAMEMFNLLDAEEAYIETPSISPLRYPTVSVKYTGTPPTDVFADSKLIQEYRELRRIEGDTIVYSADLASMTITLEKLMEGEPFEYRELSSTVPYGYCLDFIEENLGKESDTLEDFVLIKIECNQDDLGIQF